MKCEAGDIYGLVDRAHLRHCSAAVKNMITAALIRDAISLGTRV